MLKIFIGYPDKIFLNFIKELFVNNKMKVETATNGGLIFNRCQKFQPDLLILKKDMPSLDIEGFFIRKKMSSNLKFTPFFLVGDFIARELLNYKKEYVKAFISPPLNPYALLERVKLFFKMPVKKSEHQTPMLTDINVKGNIIVIQIEGNFDSDKLILVNYKIRSYCHAKKIAKPRLLFVFPSFYPETITMENLKLLFRFTTYPELEITPNQIKILTSIQKFKEVMIDDALFCDFEFVPDYIYAIRILNLDFDHSQKIPFDFIEPDSSYILDLYNDDGQVVIPAYTKITEEIIEDLKKFGEKRLTYYSDQNIVELNNQEKTNLDMDHFDKLEAMMSDFESIEEYNEITVIGNEKIHLFLSKMRGQGALVVTKNTEDAVVLNDSLGSYLDFDHLLDGHQAMEIIENKKKILVFLDNAIMNPTALNILEQIRNIYSRRQITVIILTKKIDRITLSAYKKAGTDYIILTPFSTSKMLQKIFNFISADRKT